MENSVQELLDMLYTMITEAWGLPLGAEKCVTVSYTHLLNLPYPALCTTSPLPVPRFLLSLSLIHI